MTRKETWIFIALGLAMRASQEAQTLRATRPDPVLEALVARAEAASPELDGARAAVEAAKQRIAPAKALPDPSVWVSYQNDGTHITLGERDMTFLGATYSQPLPWPGKLRLAGEEAELRAREVEASALGRTRLALDARVATAYTAYRLALAQLEVAGEKAGIWRDVEAVARARYGAGLGVQQDVLRAQAELLRIDETRADLEGEITGRRAELNRLIGSPADAPIPSGTPLDLGPEAPSLEALLVSIRDRSPELSAVVLAASAARSRVEIARKDLKPDFTASAGPMYRGGLDPMWQAGIGITLPLFSGSRQRPRIAAAEADVRSEEARRAALDRDLETATRSRYARLAASLEIAKLYGAGLLPVDRLAVESALASYRAGKVPFVSVLDAVSTLSADRATYLSRLAESERWRIALDEADPQTAAMPAAAAAAVPTTSSGAGSAMSSGPSMR